MFKKWTMDQVEARLAEIEAELKNNPEAADTEKLQTEVEGLQARKAEIKAEERTALLNSVAAMRGTPAAPGAAQKSNEEVRSSKAYIEAYANYLKSKNHDDTEVRALLTENVEGTVPVPTMVEDTVKTAWERNGIIRRAKRTYFKGDVKQGFEISGSDATTRTEGVTSVSAETLLTGIVKLVPQDIAKWVEISRETYKLGGEAFLRYIYSELAYKIAKQAAKDLITKIIACSTVATATQVSVGEITATQVGVGIVAKALAELSDEAVEPVVMINKKTWGALKDAQYANKFNVDPFEGLPVEFDNSIPSFSAATTGDTWMIVGDLANGAQVNLPNGEGVDIENDTVTAFASGMVKINGSEMVAVEPIAPLAFTKVKK